MLNFSGFCCCQAVAAMIAIFDFHQPWTLWQFWPNQPLFEKAEHQGSKVRMLFRHWKTFDPLSWIWVNPKWSNRCLQQNGLCWAKTADSAKLEASPIKESLFCCKGQFWAHWVNLPNADINFPNSVSNGSQKRANLHCGKVCGFEGLWHLLKHAPV